MNLSKLFQHWAGSAIWITLSHAKRAPLKAAKVPAKMHNSSLTAEDTVKESKVRKCVKHRSFDHLKTGLLDPFQCGSNEYGRYDWVWSVSLPYRPRPFMHTAWHARVWCAHLICSKLRCLPVVLFRKFSTALVLLCLVSMHSGFLSIIFYHFAERQLPFLTHLFNIQNSTHVKLNYWTDNIY